MNLMIGVDQRSTTEGWLSLDTHGNPDLRTDAATMSGVSGRFEIIVASHVLEHMPCHGTGEMRVNRMIEVLALWRSFLTADGQLFISVPDLDLLVQQIRLNSARYWAMGGTQYMDLLGPIFGGQERQANCHYMVFNFACLEHCLRKAGFLVVQRVDRIPQAEFNEASLDIRSLNVTAYL